MPSTWSEVNREREERKFSHLNEPDSEKSFYVITYVVSDRKHGNVGWWSKTRRTWQARIKSLFLRTVRSEQGSSLYVMHFIRPIHWCFIQTHTHTHIYIETSSWAIHNVLCSRSDCYGKKWRDLKFIYENVTPALFWKQFAISFKFIRSVQSFLVIILVSLSMASMHMYLRSDRL